MSGLVFTQAEFPTRRARQEWVERANQFTHVFGALLSIVGAGWLVSSASAVGDFWLSLGCWISAGSMVLLYVASALSHSFRRGWWKHTFRTLDQVSIFLMISGGYTPVGLTVAREYWPVLAAIWALTLAGIATKLFVTGIRNVPMWFYVVCGWMPLLAAPPIIEHFSIPALCWIVVGGLCYTAGTIFLANDERRACFHPLWHVMVIAGSACHFVVIQQFLVPSLG